MYRWVIQGQYKLILTYNGKNNYQSKMHNQMDKRPQLYDLTADPHETKNLATSKPELLAKLVKALDKWYQVTQVACQTTFKP